MNKEDIINYVVDNFKFFDNKEDIFCEEIGDGNINYVYILKDEKQGKSLVVKKSDVLLRSSGRPLDINRSKIEKDVLKIESQLLPNSVPEVYYYDEKNSIIIMEDISRYKNLRKELLEGNIYDHLSENLSDFLAYTLLPTTDLVMSRKEKKENVKKFINPDLCDITEDLVLTEPYYNYKNRNIISENLESFVEDNLYNNKKLHFEVLKLKDKFQNTSQALLHGDLHLGSIFASEDGIKVIDPEFSFYGPIGYDIGNVWGNLIFPLINFIVRSHNDEIIDKLYLLLEETIDKTNLKINNIYDMKVEFPFFKNDEFKKYYLKEIKNDSFGYAGTEVIRRTVGDSKVIEITGIKDLDKREFLDKTLIKIGIDLIINRKIYENGSDIVNLIKMKVDEYDK